MRPWILSLVLVLMGCAASGSPPAQELTIADHEAIARGEDARAAALAARYDPNAAREHPRCPEVDICWSSWTNPTGKYLGRAERARQRAAEHRAASQTLRDAEVRACSRVPEQDLETSPLGHREEITGVEAKYVRVPVGKPPRDGQLAGAVVSYRPTPGLSVESLQHLVDCHLARNAAVGGDTAMPYCPLALKDVKATVTPSRDGFDVTILSDDPAIAGQVLERSMALLSP
jgi:hypothetical protein